VTPAEHQAAAEKLIGTLAEEDLGTPYERYALTLAQVHATLATVQQTYTTRTGAL